MGGDQAEPQQVVPATTDPRRMLSRRDFIAGAAGAAASGALPAASLRATPAQVLRIAMTAADVPTPTGIPNNGFEGYRFMGYTAYDALVNWDLLHHHDKPAEITPGLFTSWHTDPNDIKRWILACVGTSGFTTARRLTPMR